MIDYPFMDFKDALDFIKCNIRDTFMDSVIFSLYGSYVLNAIIANFASYYNYC